VTDPHITVLRLTRTEFLLVLTVIFLGVSEYGIGGRLTGFNGWQQNSPTLLLGAATLALVFFAWKSPRLAVSESGRYGMVTLSIAFILRTWGTGLTYSMGAFLLPLCSSFGWSLGEAAIAPALSLLVLAVSQPLLGRLVDVIGPKRVIIVGSALTGISFIMLSYIQSLYYFYLVYGLIGGFGIGASTSVPIAVLITNWFKNRRGVAISIANAGIGFGVPALLPLSNWLIEFSGWRLAFLTLGIATFAVILPITTLLIRDKPRGNSAVDTIVDEEFQTPMRDVFKSKLFWQLLVPYTICGFTVYLMGIHLIPLAVSFGISQSAASIAAAWLGIAMTTGLVFAGYLVDIIGGKTMLILSYFVRGLAMLLLLAPIDLLSIYLFSTIFGLVELATIPPTVMFCREFFGAKSMGTVYGLVFMGHQLGGSLSAYLAGFLADLMGGYNLVLVLAVGLAFTAAGISTTISPRKPTL